MRQSRQSPIRQCKSSTGRVALRRRPRPVRIGDPWAVPGRLASPQVGGPLGQRCWAAPAHGTVRAAVPSQGVAATPAVSFGGTVPGAVGILILISIASRSADGTDSAPPKKTKSPDQEWPFLGEFCHPWHSFWRESA